RSPGRSGGGGVAAVALGYHWPTDALAGWALGIVLGSVGRAVIAAAPGPAVPPRGHPVAGPEPDLRERSGDRATP
ncbi:hypothetical protein AB0J52_26375, partial [Spirillospora sp. NPDC049652]